MSNLLANIIVFVVLVIITSFFVSLSVFSFVTDDYCIGCMLGIVSAIVGYVTCDHFCRMKNRV